ncbi:MAG: hypothetical protein H6799_01800 [Candidatus Nomurabacteria bacterium]|nr:MAG: hypothetical protein H6799_01800 [Candidatus Nomurabacteria bacterium]HRV75885.1 hypothetical protein [Candidatus Saccharimonadales bacterium]
MPPRQDGFKGGAGRKGEDGKDFLFVIGATICAVATFAYSVYPDLSDLLMGGLRYP